MKVYEELNLKDFESWSGATETKNIIINEGKEEEFEELIEELFPNGVSATELNDLLWFENDWIYSCLGIQLDDNESNCNINVI